MAPGQGAMSPGKRAHGEKRFRRCARARRAAGTFASAAALTAALVLAPVVATRITAAPGAEPEATTAAPSPPPPPRVATTGWSEYRSAHFTALSNAAPRRTLDLMRRLERFRHVLSMLYAKLSVDAPVETLLVVIRDADTLSTLAPRFDGRAVELNGVFLSRPDGNLIMANGSSQGDPLPTVYHEYMHYFTATNFPPLPLWFSEGIAECYGTFRTDENSADIGRVQDDHIAYLRSSVLIPLEELFSIGHESREYNEGSRRGVFYAESWALTHYLLWDNPTRKPQLGDFLERLGNREAPVAAFEAAFGTDLDTFMNELRQNIGQNRFKYSIAQFKDQSFEKEVRTRAVDPAEAAARLAEALIAFEPTRVPEARALLAPALTAAPVPGAAWRALGRVEQADDKPEAAVAAYRRAVAADPADGRAALFLGLALLEQRDAASVAAARATLRTAMQARPEFAELSIAFGRTLAEVPGGSPSDIDLAIEHLRKALQVLPYRPDLAMLLTQLWVERGDLDHAEAFARSVLPRLVEPSIANDMRQYIAARRAASSSPTSDATASEQGAEPEDPPPLPTDPTAAGTAPAGGGSPLADREPTAGRLPRVDEAEIKQLLAAPPGLLLEGEWILVFNQAAALGNVRRYKEALALLDRLTPGCRFPDMKEQLVDLRVRLARDAQRAGQTTR